MTKNNRSIDGHRTAIQTQRTADGEAKLPGPSQARKGPNPMEPKPSPTEYGQG